MGAKDRAGKDAAVIRVPLRTGRGLNNREHWAQRARRAQNEKSVVGWYLGTTPRPKTPCEAVLTRCGPSNGLDDDNLAGALKSVRDAVAAWLGVDDRRSDVVRYVYAQRRDREWAVEIEFREL